ncbi:MAG: TetR family transcriptional regulator [Rhodobacteraceae bacterium]|nr:TetR family transcriptional regulator [Paracoccaceae bacterium]
MIGSKSDGKRSRGRPRGFDERQAIAAAMRIFWLQGYEAASIDTLIRGMGMSRASLYHTFGDKERLFLAAVRVYAEGPFAAVVAQLHSGGSLHDDLMGFFTGLIGLTAQPQGARGCLVSCVLADAAGENEEFRKELAQRLAEIEQQIACRLELAVADGDLPSNASTKDLAAVIASVARGLTVAARAAKPADDLGTMARTAIDLVLARH